MSELAAPIMVVGLVTGQLYLVEVGSVAALASALASLYAHFYPNNAVAGLVAEALPQAAA